MKQNTPAATPDTDTCCPPQAAEAVAILQRYLVAWQLADPAERLAACSRCKLDTLVWQQRWSDDRSALARAAGRSDQPSSSHSASTLSAAGGDTLSCDGDSCCRRA